MSILRVGTSKSYPINVTRGLKELPEMAKSIVKGNKVAIVTDDKVNSLYGGALDFAFEGKEILKIVIPHGEENKNAENFLYIINTLAENKFTRKDTLVTFGGGVIGDIGAFAASTYMRGISLIAVPTTLLSMVDSSVGGKTAIDLPTGKNLLGTFYQPNGVFINLDFIKTLPERELFSGYGEVIKYAFLRKDVSLSSISSEINEDLITKCLEIKREIVEKDEKEGSIRKLLNLGHTVGHAIESLSNYKLSHGECVLKGIIYAIEISQKLYCLEKNEVSQMFNLLNSKGKVEKSEFSAEDLVKKIKSDKKSDGDGVDFVTVKGIGNPVIKHLGFEELYKLLEN